MSEELTRATELEAIKIGDLPAVSTVKDADSFVLEQDGIAKKLTGAKLLEYSKADPGTPGAPGAPGTPGKDGVSPTVSTETVTDGTKVTITDAKGDHSFTVTNGKDGEEGPVGPPGPSGKDGQPGKDGMPGADGKNALINGRNVVTLKGGTNVTLDENTPGEIVINVTGGGSDEPGPQGPAGQDAGFGTLSATIDGGVGEPSVEVEESGPNTAKDITWKFHNLKGETGERGADGTPGERGESGLSPTVDVQGIVGGHKVTITDESGPHEFDVMNGERGPAGADGLPGSPGEPGKPGKDATINGENAIATDETMSMKGNVLGVTLPTKSLTKKEYNDLSEEKKQGVLYVVIDED